MIVISIKTHSMDFFSLSFSLQIFLCLCIFFCILFSVFLRLLSESLVFMFKRTLISHLGTACTIRKQKHLILPFCSGVEKLPKLSTENSVSENLSNHINEICRSIEISSVAFCVSVHLFLTLYHALVTLKTR